MRTCSFCKEEIEEGTGKMYVKKKMVPYTSSVVVNVKKNMIKLGRVPRKVKWVKEN